MHSNLTFACAQECDTEEIHALYQSLVGTPMCAWSEEYPDLETVSDDISRGNTFIVRKLEGKIIAALAAGAEDDVHVPDSGEFGWALDLLRPCGFSRLGVMQSEQGKGLACALMRFALESARERGFDGARLMVGANSAAARSVYAKLGFEGRGRVYMYGNDFLCMERLI